MRKLSRIAFAAVCLAAAPVMAAEPIPNPSTVSEKPEAGKLIGHRIENTEGQRIGEIEAIHINRNTGRVENVIVGVGGFLGLGERDVAIPWKTLKISQDGTKVTTELTKDKLKEMPAYNYPMPNYRGTVFEMPPF